MATASSSGNQRAAENYQGEKGQRYAEWQLRASRGTGEIVARTHFLA
jgi:hypothetical protein